MDDVDLQIRDLSGVRPGQIVEVWHHGMLRHRGRVEESMPRLGVMWIRETGSGDRKMISVEDHSLYYG